MKFGENLPRSFFEILKKSEFQKSEVGKFIPNFPLKHVITSTKNNEILPNLPKYREINDQPFLFIYLFYFIIEL